MQQIQKSGFQFLIDEAEKKKNAGENMEAIKLCEKILVQDLDCGEAYEEIGDNYLTLHQHEKAKKALLEALRINSKSANANYLLGFIYSALGDFKRSIEFLEQANEIQPNHPEILRCLGWSIFHDSQRKRGVIILERALNLKKDDPLILSDLGVCYLNEKNFERSSILFRKVLELDPNNVKAKECLNAVRFFQKEFKKFKEENV